MSEQLKPSTVKDTMVFIVNTNQLVVADSMIEAIETFNEAYPGIDITEVKRFSPTISSNYKAIIKTKSN